MTLTSKEIWRRADEAIAEREASYAAWIPTRLRGRSPSPAERKRLSKGVHRYYARKAFAEGDVSLVKRARLERGLTLQQAAALAGLALNTIWNAERPDHQTSKRTIRALSRAYGIPVKALRRG